MLRGININELAAKITANSELKHDLVADTRHLSMLFDDDGQAALAVQDKEPQSLTRFGIRPLAHQQIGDKIGIPKKYYDRMLKEAPELLAENVNHWFQNDPDTRMIRTLGGDVRAVLSNRYQRIENEEILEKALPALMEFPQINIVSAQVTESRMYIQAVFPKLEAEVKKGDLVQAGIVISNSEVGLGSVSVRAMIWRLICENGLIVPDNSFSARHVGSKILAGEGIEHLLTDETKRADDHAVLLKVRDVVIGTLKEASFLQTVDKMRAAAGEEITGDPIKAVEVLAKKMSFTDPEKGSILRNLIKGGDLSRWGVVNAVTALAHDAQDYDRSVEFEAIGGNLLDLAPGEWAHIAEAA